MLGKLKKKILGPFDGPPEGLIGRMAMPIACFVGSVFFAQTDPEFVFDWIGICLMLFAAVNLMRELAYARQPKPPTDEALEAENKRREQEFPATFAWWTAIKAAGFTNKMGPETTRLSVYMLTYLVSMLILFDFPKGNMGALMASIVPVWLLGVVIHIRMQIKDGRRLLREQEDEKNAK